jgi:hypothetical protein
LWKNERNSEEMPKKHTPKPDNKGEHTTKMHSLPHATGKR